MGLTSPSTTTWDRKTPGIVASEGLLEQMIAQAAAAEAAAAAAEAAAAEAAAGIAAAANSAAAAEAAASNANAAASIATDAAIAAAASAEAAASSAGGVAEERLIPAGGSTGEVLSKISGTDYNVGWVEASGGAEELDDLTDVNTSGVENGQALVFLDGDWVPGGEVITPRPATLLSGLDVLAEVETLSGLSNGDAVSTWGDLGSGSAAEYATADVEDGAPSVVFAPAGGAAAEYFETVLGSLYTGKEMTGYLVHRQVRQGNNNARTVWGFSENGENMASGIRPFIQSVVGTFPAVPSIAFNFNSNVVNPGTFGRGVGRQWVVTAFRIQPTVDATGVAQLEIMYLSGGYVTRAHIADTSLDTDRFRIGTGYGNFGGATLANATNGAIDGAVRFVGLLLGAHTDPEMRSIINYLRQQYNAA